MTQATDKDQLSKFKEAAKAAEADMDEKSFDKALGKLAKSDPPKKNETPKPENK